MMKAARIRLRTTRIEVEQLIFMCGILGIIDLGQGLGEELYSGFSTAFGFMHGRGPDGYWIYGENNLLMGQALLQITDPDGDIKPYVSNDLNIIACANGEIYNSKDLRRLLEQEGALFETDSDCEVIAHGYSHWKENLFERLDGMFAIAIFNRATQTLLLVRDRVGIRPLYYTLKSNAYAAFASEPRMLTGSGLASREISPTGHFQALLLRRPMEPYTMYKDVFAVPPGHFIRFQQNMGAPVVHPFAAMPKPLSQPASLAHEPTGEQHPSLVQALATAVNKRVPTSCDYSLFLSGGLDSSLVNYLAPANDAHRLPSLVAGFSFTGGIDERELAQKAASIINTRLVSRSMGMDEFLALWPLLVWLNDEPLMFNSSVPLFSLCREARQMGAKVILSGEGADEMFIGYSQYPAYQVYKDDGTADYLLRHDQEIIPLATVMDDWVIDSNWAKQEWDQLQTQINALLPFQGHEHGLARKLEFDRMTFMRGLLMRQDRVGLNASIEIRVPFLDVKLMQTANAFPVDQHLRQGLGKILLRDAFEPFLGRELTQTPKIGFPLPLPVWLLEPRFQQICLTLNEMLNRSGLVKQNAIFNIMSTSGHYSATSYRHIWTLLNLALWWVNSSSDEFPPHGIWASVIPSESLSYVDGIVQESCRPFAPGFVYKALEPQSLPSILHAKRWTSPRANRLEELFTKAA